MVFIGRTPVIRGTRKLGLPIPDGIPVYWSKQNSAFLCKINQTTIIFPKKFILYIELET